MTRRDGTQTPMDGVVQLHVAMVPDGQARAEWHGSLGEGQHHVRVHLESKSTQPMDSGRVVESGPIRGIPASVSFLHAGESACTFEAHRAGERVGGLLVTAKHTFPADSMERKYLTAVDEPTARPHGGTLRATWCLPVVLSRRATGTMVLHASCDGDARIADMHAEITYV